MKYYDFCHFFEEKYILEVISRMSFDILCFIPFKSINNTIRTYAYLNCEGYYQRFLFICAVPLCLNSQTIVRQQSIQNIFKRSPQSKLDGLRSKLGRCKFQGQNMTHFWTLILWAWWIYQAIMNVLGSELGPNFNFLVQKNRDVIMNHPIWAHEVGHFSNFWWGGSKCVKLEVGIKNGLLSNI